MNLSPADFKAPFLTREEIRSKAEEFRKKYNLTKLPIDIINVIECDLDIYIDPVRGLKEQADTDAFLSLKTRILYVDYAEFEEDRFQNRLRFSLAHEIGHMVLHEDFFRNLTPRTVEEWITFSRALPADQSRYLEWHANEFAGRLLVPREALELGFNQAMEYVDGIKESIGDISRDLVLDYIASNIAREFGVSSDVVKYRIKNEAFWRD